MWDGDHRPLSMAIQYVVMLKTQDIRPWMNDGPLMDDEYPQLLRQAIRREWPGQSIQHIRLGLDRDRKAHGFRSRGMWCLLFDTIEARAGSRTSISDLHRRSCLVDTKDLQALRNALDGLGTQSAGHPALLPFNIASQVVNRRKMVHAKPTTASWSAYRNYALLREYKKEWHASIAARSADTALESERSQPSATRSEVNDSQAEDGESDTPSVDSDDMST